MVYAPHPHIRRKASSNLSKSCPKNGDVPKSPFPTVAAVVPSAGTTLKIDLCSCTRMRSASAFCTSARCLRRAALSSKGESHRLSSRCFLAALNRPMLCGVLVQGAMSPRFIVIARVGSSGCDAVTRGAATRVEHDASNEFQLAPPHNVRCTSPGGFNVCHPAVARPSRLMPRWYHD